MKEFKFYSQNCEDFILWKVLQNPKGFFVDVGAFDGIYLSNSYFFENNGWEGICIEAHPENFNYCQKNRPKSKCLHLACVGNDEKKEVEFFAEDIGLYSGVLGNEEHLKDVEKRYEKNKIDFSGFQKVKVKSQTLNSLFQDHKIDPDSIDFISIDTEGNEIEILNGLDLEYYKPKIVVIEANDETQEKLLIAKMFENGYIIGKKIGVNIFFTKENSVYYERLQTTEVNCVLESMHHPKGIEYTIKEYLTKNVICKGNPDTLLEVFRNRLPELPLSDVEKTEIYEAYVSAYTYKKKIIRFENRNEELKTSLALVRKSNDKLETKLALTQKEHDKIEVSLNLVRNRQIELEHSLSLVRKRNEELNSALDTERKTIGKLKNSFLGRFLLKRLDKL